MATLASTAAAEEPHPIPRGMSLSRRIAKGVMCLPSRSSRREYVSTMRLPGILPHRSALQPYASMVNSVAGMAPTLKPKSNARAAASKAGPRFAEVAGRNMRKGMADRSLSAIALFLRLERPQNRVSIGIQHNWCFSLPCRQGMKFVVSHARDGEVGAMKLDGVLRVLQHVPGQDEHRGLAGLHESTLH